LAQYLEFVAALPLPTQEQKEQFAEYVSHAHSWYKHLSLYPPGTPFHFFLDRYAGSARKDGTPFIKDRTEPGEHYNQIPTDVYRTAFGYLAYSTGSRNEFPLVVPVVEETPIRAGGGTPGTGVTNTLRYGVPPDIFEAGVARLTGVIHTLSASADMPWQCDKGRRPDQIDWPAESGGPAALNRIVDRCRQLQADVQLDVTGIERWPLEKYPHSSHHLPFVDPVLYELLGPERRRLRGQIIQAIDRVCEVIERETSHRH
jgi:hypothetical protein